ncbi:thyroid hormone receptor alpha-like [Macrobrachium nipponense]|uniref:thyroid hormone receptor alpha-like n=1 Tax=Macrobrachium nipponense TaxID=159736 RepID=UPI0030C8B190
MICLLSYNLILTLLIYRFQKCEKVGMKMDWVMTESGRMNLFKNRLARTRQMKEEKKKERLYGDLPRALSFNDAFAIKKILDTLHATFGSMPYPEECKGDSIDSLSNIFVYLCKRFGKFFLKITEDTDLCEEDKTLLLKNGISMSLYISGAHMYDPVSRSWPASTTHESIKVPHLTLETLEKLATIPDAFSTIMKFYSAYENDLKDHVVAVLMYLISFFLSDDPCLIDCTSVQKQQNEYLGYLKRYLVARDGQKSVSGIFRKLLDGINYVKDILKYHTMVDIKPTIDHTNLSVFAKDAIAQSMANLMNQIEMSFKRTFPPYASILKEEEKEALGMGSHSTALVKERGTAVMQNHPDTIALFGSTTRTDQLIVSPFLKLIEWNKAGPEQLPRVKPSLEGIPASEAAAEGRSSSGSETEEASAGGNTEEEVDVDAVCDILKKLSHTDDPKMINIFKENIPKELLEKFSRNLADHHHQL